MSRWAGYLLLGMLAAGFAVRARAEGGARTEDVRKELLEREQMLWAARKSGDETRWRALVAADVMIYKDGARSTGGDWAGSGAAAERGVARLQMEAKALGPDAGMVVYREAAGGGGAANEEPAGPRTVADTWRRKGGKWLLVFEMSTLAAPEPGAEEKRIRGVLEAQQAAWNRGDIDAFMRGYWNSPRTEFVTAEQVVHGWQGVLDRYHKTYPGRAAMGTLAFSDLEIELVSPTAALVTGEWKLQRAKDQPGGTFTLIFRRFPDGWKITNDHTSEKK